MRTLLLAATMLILPLPPVAAQSAGPSEPTGGWVPPADHGEAVRRAHRDLELLDGLLDSRPDDAWYRLQRLRLLYFLGVDQQEHLARVDEEAARIAFLRGRDGRETAPVAAAYRGAAEVLRAKHALWPGTKTRHLKAGLAVLDELVAQHPDDPEIRYLRLVSTAYLPFLFGRRDGARQDARALSELLLAERVSFPAPTLVAMTGVLLESGRLDGEVRRRIEALRNAAAATAPSDPLLALALPIPQREGDRESPDESSPDSASPSGGD
jgi:hypothetical protein